MDAFLLGAALMPAVALMWYVYSRDKIEREPLRLVVRVLLLGALSGIVAGIVESLLFGMGEAVIPAGTLLLVVEYFVCVAAVEELCKFACLRTVKNNPAFDHIFDAIVYSVAAALGFAALENVFYVFDPVNGGLGTAALRAVLSVPGHAADGVVMGVFFGLARRRELRGDRSGARLYYVLSVLLPVIEHGFYDAALSTESDVMALAAIAVDLAFVVLAFFLVRHMAARDEPLHPLGSALQGAPLRPGTPQARASMTMPVGYVPPQGVPMRNGQGGFSASDSGFMQSQVVPGQPQGVPVQPQTASVQPQDATGQPQGASVQPQGVPIQPQGASTQTAFVVNQSQAVPTPAQQPFTTAAWYCPGCGRQNAGNYCENCGSPRPR